MLCTVAHRKKKWWCVWYPGVYELHVQRVIKRSQQNILPMRRSDKAGSEITTRPVL